MNKKPLLLLAAWLVGFIFHASAQYQGWRHSGSIAILTTPEGANLPATASEGDFPMLVRLNKDRFDFAQAKANGDDIRFASDAGTPSVPVGQDPAMVLCPEKPAAGRPWVIASGLCSALNNWYNNIKRHDHELHESTDKKC